MGQLETEAAIREAILTTVEALKERDHLLYSQDGTETVIVENHTGFDEKNGGVIVTTHASRYTAGFGEAGSLSQRVRTLQPRRPRTGFREIIIGIDIVSDPAEECPPGAINLGHSLDSLREVQLRVGFDGMVKDVTGEGAHAVRLEEKEGRQTASYGDIHIEILDPLEMITNIQEGRTAVTVLPRNVSQKPDRK